MFEEEAVVGQSPLTGIWTVIGSSLWERWCLTVCQPVAK